MCLWREIQKIFLIYISIECKLSLYRHVQNRRQAASGLSPDSLSLSLPSSFFHRERKDVFDLDRRQENSSVQMMYLHAKQAKGVCVEKSVGKHKNNSSANQKSRFSHDYGSQIDRKQKIFLSLFLSLSFSCLSLSPPLSFLSLFFQLPIAMQDRSIFFSLHKHRDLYLSIYIQVFTADSSV